MFNLLKNEKSGIKKYQFLLNQINTIENSTKNLTDTEIKENIYKLKKKYTSNQKISKDLIIQSFSLTREASIRTIGLRHFNEQIIGGLVLNEGKIAEMKTGEGKTLVSTLPIALNALTENGVHLVTVNDYLAKRDFEWMKEIYNYLGLTSGLIQSEMNEDERKINYQKDITYVTNSELGFDFLRDNMCFDSSNLVQRPFSYCIIDEVDSILIDEARTPLIISGESSTDSNIYIQASEISKYLKKDIDFEADEKTNNIVLTGKGVRQIERILGISNIFETNQPWLFFIINALKAENFFLKNVQYIIQNNSICIVDEFTGRIMPDRRWNNGLHEAIEAKENIRIKAGTKQLASITYQNFFTLYPKLSGMTGTAKTDEVELEKIYNLEVVVIPTVRPFKREDLTDQVYINEIAKWKSVAKTCAEMYKIGRPTLVGTNSIEKSEIISLILNDYDVPHKLLNARPEILNLESEIIAEAGCRNSIVISTNMAGRGTDIILGGNLNFKINKLILFLIYKKEMVLEKNRIKFLILKILIDQIITDENYILEENYNNFSDLDFSKLEKQSSFKKLITTLFFYLKINYQVKFDFEKKKVLQLGGLFVIGTERHESRRIDNQLRGRAARQGDPGSSRFFISLEDRVFRLFGGNNFKKLIKTFQLNNETIPLESNFLTKSLDIAQEKIENYYYEIRKSISEYDDVLNQQRKVFYSTRSLVLNTYNIRNWIVDIGEIVILELVSYFKNSKKIKNNEITKEDISELKKLFGFSFDFDLKDLEEIPDSVLFNFLREYFWLTYDIKEINYEILLPGFYRNFEKQYLLQAIDFCWSEHLDKMAELRESVVWRVYGQSDPLLEYKKEAFKLFLFTSKQIGNFLIFAVLSSNFAE